MTQTQRKQLTRAFQIAARDALRAIRGTTRDGQPVYAVLNRRATAKAGYPVYHLLTVDSGSNRIRCDCPAHINGRVCAHAAAARAAIQAERAAAAVHQVQADAAARVATASARTARRDASGPAPRPAFSMWA